MKQIRYSRTAAKSLLKFDSQLKARMEEAILEIATNPLIGKKLKGDFAKEGLRSLRIWPYRVVYRFDSNHLDIVFIEHRKDVYR